jgi:hypothetical protein
MPSRFATYAVWLLRIVLLIQCMAQASLYVLDPINIESPAYEWMVGTSNIDADAARLWDDRIAFAAVAAAVALVCFPLLLMVVGPAGSDRWPWTIWQVPLLIGLIAWNVVLQVGNSMAAGSLVGNGAAEVATIVAGGMPRIVVSLALCILCFRSQDWTPRDVAVRMATSMLRVSTVAAFSSLAWRAIHFDPAMIDAVLGTARNVIGWSLDEDVAQFLVCGVGIVSAALAVCLLFFRWQRTTLALALLGAVWLVVGLGEGGFAQLGYAYPVALLRIAMVGAPLAIVLLQHSRRATPREENQNAVDDELVIVGADP